MNRKGHLEPGRTPSHHFSRQWDLFHARANWDAHITGFIQVLYCCTMRKKNLLGPDIMFLAWITDHGLVSFFSSFGGRSRSRSHGGKLPMPLSDLIIITMISRLLNGMGRHGNSSGEHFPGRPRPCQCRRPAGPRPGVNAVRLFCLEFGEVWAGSERCKEPDL